VGCARWVRQCMNLTAAATAQTATCSLPRSHRLQVLTCICAVGLPLLATLSWESPAAVRQCHWPANTRHPRDFFHHRVVRHFFHTLLSHRHGSGACISSGLFLVPRGFNKVVHAWTQLPQVWVGPDSPDAAVCLTAAVLLLLLMCSMCWQP
jgi:hypothetical protein